MTNSANSNQKKLAFERRYSLEELSQRWNKPISYIEECIRRYEFRRIIHHFKDIVQHCYFNEAIWPHGKEEGSIQPRGPGEINRFVKPHPAGFRSNALTFVPEEEVILFEQARNKGPEQQEVAPSSFKFNWIKSKDLKIALEAYHDLYELKKIRPGQAHKHQIKKWLIKRHGSKLSKHKTEMIATLVNLDKKGGAPTR